MKVWVFTDYSNGEISVFDSKEKALSYYQALQKNMIDLFEEPLWDDEWDIKECEFNPVYQDIV